MANVFTLLAGPKEQKPLLPGGKNDGRELPRVDESRRIRLAVIVGHEQSNQGAKLEVNGDSEYTYNSRIAKLMQKIAKERYPQIEVDVVFRDGVGVAGAYQIADEKLHADLVLELHFNAANGRARGSETLCSSAPNDIEFAHIIHRQVARIFGRIGTTHDRGVKVLSRTSRGGQNVHSFPGGANCLVEPFFGDNRDDGLLGIAKMDLYAEALVAGAQLYAEKKDMVSRVVFA